MRKSIVALTVLMAVSACQDRENPLLKADQYAVAKWVYEHREWLKTKQEGTIGLTETCGAVWRDSEQSLVADNCNENYAPQLATEMKDAGFGDIRAEDVKLPTLWIRFFEIVKKKTASRRHNRLPKKVKYCKKSKIVGWGQGGRKCQEWGWMDKY